MSGGMTVLSCNDLADGQERARCGPRGACVSTTITVPINIFLVLFFFLHLPLYHHVPPRYHCNHYAFYNLSQYHPSSQRLGAE
jgi:hypothetical protein